jgi:hypothetical protein
VANSVIYNKFRQTNLARFIASLDNNPLYMGVGRPYFWNPVASNENILNTNNSIKNEMLDWEDMMFMKRIYQDDVAYGIRHITWTAGERYDQYRTDWNGARKSVYDSTFPTSISESASFVVNDVNDLYVCLKQPASIAGEIPMSVDSPETGVDVGVGTGILKTSDGYYWKYMATATSDMIIKFASTITGDGRTYMFYPVKTLPVDDASKQWDSQVLSANYKGGIYAINILSQGSGYNGGTAGSVSVTDAKTNDYITVVGDGSGLEFNITYGSSGVIVDIEVTNPGSGYTHAYIDAKPGGSSGTGFVAEAIITSPSGLGCDPIKDTDAVYLLLSSEIEADDGSGYNKVTSSNDYRKISIVSNPLQFGSVDIYLTNDIVDCTTTLLLDIGAGTFVPDEIVIVDNLGIKARVVDYDSANRRLRVIRTSSENENSPGASLNYAPGQTINTNTATISSVSPQMNEPFSGDIIYSEYRVPIQLAPNTPSHIHCVIQF